MKHYVTDPLLCYAKRRRCHRVAKKIVAPVPRPFDFGFTPQRPLVPMRAVTMFLNRDAKDVLSLIEDGKLRWAFDIRSVKATHREVRVLRQSLFEFGGLYSPSEPLEERGDLEFLKIINSVLPPGVVVSPSQVFRRGKATTNFHVKMRVTSATFRKLLFPREPILRGTEVARCFCCLPQHVLNLVKEKSLQGVNLRLGPKASPLITRASVVQFLKERRMS
jgi:hypothetical protein